MAVGIIEVQGFGAALAVADAMCKEADICIDAFDANNPVDSSARIPVIVQIKFRGGVSDIYAALETGVREARERMGQEGIVTTCIPMENEELLPLVKEGKLKPHENEKIKENVKKTDKTGKKDGETNGKVKNAEQKNESGSVRSS